MKRYTPEQKAQGIRMVLGQGLSQKEVAKRLSVSKTILGNWILAYKKGVPFEGIAPLGGQETPYIKTWSKWSDERLLETAKKYTRLKDFFREEREAYTFARRKGLLEKVTANMERKLTSWTLPMISQAAARHLTRIDFEKKDPKACSAARHMGVMDQVCAHMLPVHQEWTREGILTVARKYTSFTEFYIKENTAYQAARRNNLIEEVRSHMKETDRGNGSTCVYLYQFKDAQYVGLSLNRVVRFKAHKKKGVVWNYSQSIGQPVPLPIILHDRLTVPEARRLEREEVANRRTQGLRVLNTRAGGDLGSLPQWNPTKVKAEALKYSSRRQFQRAAMGAYLFAWRNGLLDEVCSHMPVLRRRWTDQEIVQEARRYLTRKAFRSGQMSVYTYALKRGILDAACAHMQGPRKKA